MRSSALIALLPLLATGYARPHDADSGRNGHHRHSLRKSLGFGPVHKHASFESVPLAPLSDVEVLGLVETDPVEVAKDFIKRQVGQEFGEGFYIREDVSGSQSVICQYLCPSSTLTNRPIPIARPV